MRFSLSGLPELRMLTTNKSERILENLGKNNWIRIRANLGETGAKPGKKRANLGKKLAKMGQKWANETETWQNRAKPKVSPKLYSVSGIPALYFRNRPQCLSKSTNISDHWWTCEKFISSRYELFESAPTIWAWRLQSENTLLKFWTISSYYYLVSQVDLLHEGRSKHQNMCFNPLLLEIKSLFYLSPVHVTSISKVTPVKSQWILPKKYLHF